MKALVLTQNAKLEIKNLAEEKLGPSDCRITITYAGICSSDIERAFSDGAYFYPLVMGHEITGVVTGIGSKVIRLATNDRVAVFPLLPCFSCPSCQQEKYAQCHNYNYYGSRRNGGFCQSLIVPEWNLLKLPKNVDARDAVALEPLAVVIHALNKAEIPVKKPKRMVIIGCGFLGLLAAHVIIRTFPKIELTVIDRNSQKLELIGKGVRKFALKDARAWQNFLDSQESFDLVMVANGDPRSFEHSLSLANHGGKIVWMGNILSDLNLNKKLVSSVLRKELTILGTWNSLYRPAKTDDWQKALRLIGKGLHPKDFVSHWVTLDKTAETLKKLYRHKMKQESFPSMKVIIDLKNA